MVTESMRWTMAKKDENKISVPVEQKQPQKPLDRNAVFWMAFWGAMLGYVVVVAVVTIIAIIVRK